MACAEDRALLKAVNLEMSDKAVQLRQVQSFFVGGGVHTLSGLPVQERRIAMGASARRVDPNGDHMAGQMYVQRFALSAPRAALPVLMWHGGGMTGSHWESTPDGRPGWLWRFLQQGYDVYVSDAVERGRSSWAMFPEIYREPPLFRSRDEGWHMFRLGPQGGYATLESDRLAFPETRFPIEAFDEFAKQWVPRWADHEELTLAAYSALIERVGPCIVLAHSQGGGFAVAAAQRHPQLVKAVVVVEPAGMPEFNGQLVCPHLALWGDYVEQHTVWKGYRALADRYWAAAREAGLAFESLDLPQAGMAGNSHFPMCDRNSDQIAERIFHWLDRVVPPTSTY